MSGNKWQTTPIDAGGDVTASANMTDNTLLKGDGGAKGIQDTAITCDDSDNVANMLTLVVGAASGSEAIEAHAAQAQIKIRSTDTNAGDVAELGFQTTQVGGLSSKATIKVGEVGGAATEGQFVVETRQGGSLVDALKLSNDGSLQLHSYGVGYLTSDVNGDITSEVNLTDVATITTTGNVVVAGQISSSGPTSTPTGTTQTIDWDDGNFQIIDLGSATDNVTVSFSNGNAGGAYYLGIIQSATARTITWPAGLQWPGGTPITLSTGDNEIDFVGMVTTGSTFFATLQENNYS